MKYEIVKTVLNNVNVLFIRESLICGGEWSPNRTASRPVGLNKFKWTKPCVLKNGVFSPASFPEGKPPVVCVDEVKPRVLGLDGVQNSPASFPFGKPCHHPGFLDFVQSNQTNFYVLGFSSPKAQKLVLRQKYLVRKKSEQFGLRSILISATFNSY